MGPSTVLLKCVSRSPYQSEDQRQGSSTMSIHVHVEVFDDGKEIPSGMSVMGILNFGWNPSRTRTAKWAHENSQYIYKSAHGLSACIVPGAEYIAINENTDEHIGSSILRQISADARCQIAISNTL